MKLLLVTDIFPSARQPYTGTFIARRARQQVMNGVEIDVLTTRVLTPATIIRSPKEAIGFIRAPARFRYEWEGMPVLERRVFLPVPGHNTARSQPRLLYRAIRPELEAMLAENRYDGIYLGNGGPLASAAARYARENDIPYIASAIGGNVNCCVDRPESFMYHREREIFLGSQMVVCVSDDMNRKTQQMTDGAVATFTFRSGVDPERVRPDAETREAYRKKLDAAPGEILILFVGYIERGKGVYELIEAFGRLSDERPATRLVLVGPDREPGRVSAALARAGVAEKTIRTGGVAHDVIPGYLNAVDLFAFPSWAEGLPNAVLEACAAGLAVVASNVGGVPEIIDSEKNGLLVEPRDALALESHLKRLADSPEERRRLGQAAREKILRDFDYRKNGKPLVERLAQILTPGAKPQ